MNSKNGSIAQAQTLITPKMRKSHNKAESISRGTHRQASNLRSAAKEARDAAKEGDGSNRS